MLDGMKMVTLHLAAAFMAFCLVSPAAAGEALVRPATDGVFAAFEQHPLVGLGVFVNKVAGHRIIKHRVRRRAS